MVRQDEIEPALPCADDNRAGSFPPLEHNGFSRDRRSDRLQLRIQRVGEPGRRTGAEKETGQDGGAGYSAAHQFPHENP